MDRSKAVQATTDNVRVGSVLVFKEEVVRHWTVTRIPVCAPGAWMADMVSNIGTGWLLERDLPNLLLLNPEASVTPAPVKADDTAEAMSVAERAGYQRGWSAALAQERPAWEAAVDRARRKGFSEGREQARRVLRGEVVDVCGADAYDVDDTL